MASTPAALMRSRSAPQPITTLAASASSSEKPFIQRSLSHVDVEKDTHAKRRIAAQTTKSRQGPPVSSPSTSTPGDPFNLSGFFPTSLSAIGSEEKEWQWLREEGEEGGRRKYQRCGGDEEGTVRGGRSAIFGEETSDAIKSEDKLGVLALSRCI